MHEAFAEPSSAITRAHEINRAHGITRAHPIPPGLPATPAHPTDGTSGLPGRRLAIVRHGETDWNRRGLLQGRVDQPLNATGEAQARLAAVGLAGSALPSPSPAWARVVSSPLRRASTTARIIAEHLGLDEPTVVPEFTEQSFGRAEGTPAKTAFLTWPTGDYPEGERRSDVDSRVSAGLSRVFQDAPTEDLILVCHVIVVRSIVNTLTGVEPHEVPNGSATVLMLAPGADRWSPAPPARISRPARTPEGRP